MTDESRRDGGNGLWDNLGFAAASITALRESLLATSPGGLALTGGKVGIVAVKRRRIYFSATNDFVARHTAAKCFKAVELSLFWRNLLGAARLSRSAPDQDRRRPRRANGIQVPLSFRHEVSVTKCVAVLR